MAASGYTVLVVEDDVQILWIITQLLRSAGHKVFSADTITAAQIVWNSERPRIDLALMDIRLGDGSGMELAEQFVREKADLRVIIVSGAPPNAHDIAPGLKGNVAILEKPFTLAQFNEVVDANVLKATAGSP